jgi:hypothetical protein
MAVQVNPITQSLPATTAIQDPATRRFAQAVEDALRALRSEEGAVESLKKAADAMNNAVAGGTPPSIAQWLFSSELYQKLTTEIARVDTQAKQDVLDEALARSQAIQEIQAALAEIGSTPAYDPATTYQIGDLVTYDNKLYRAKAETTGNLPTNTTYWDKVGDYASLGDVVAAHTLQLSEIESDITDIGGDLAAEITARDTLATQLRGTYTGTEVTMVSQGLLYSERQARVTADGVTVSNLNALRAQVGVTEAGALTTGLILDEKNVRASNDLAIVSAVNTALAQITGVSTSISQSGENLIANWTQAQATKWSQIESEVLTSGGQTIRAALLQESQTRANADGSLGAQWTLKTDIDGYISGFGFASTANNAAPTSEFIIRADKFAVVMPGYGEHVPFAIGPSGAEFTGLTSWSNLKYRPDDPHNLCIKSSFEDGEKGAWVGSVSVEVANTPWSSKALLTQDRDAFLDDWFSVTPGEKIEVEAALLALYSNHTLSVGIHVVDKLGANITWLAALSSAPGEAWAIKAGTVTIPANASKARCWVQMGGSSGFGSGYVTNLRYRRFTQITSSNVTTYIDNAAIGNAQIDNAAITSAKIGTAQVLTANIGDGQITNAKIGNAAVDTLQVAGDAITAPVAGAQTDYYWAAQTVTRTDTRTVGSITTSLYGRGQVMVQIMPVGTSVLAKVINSGDIGTPVSRIRLLRNGVEVYKKQGSTITTGGGMTGEAPGSSTLCELPGILYLDSPGAGVACTYTLELYSNSGGGNKSLSHTISPLTFFIMEYRK